MACGEMEARYLPWRDYGDLPHVDRGGFWQFQRHIYLNPFYYIDYTLAQTCALQLWVQSQTNPAECSAVMKSSANAAARRRFGSLPKVWASQVLLRQAV